jgi:beta-lactamase class A
MKIFSIKKLLITAVISSAIMPYMSAIASTASIKQKIATIEASYDGRLGISAINTANNEHIQYRENERFPFCSTSKVMAVSAILKRSMHESNYLQKNITYKSDDVVTHSPITEKNIEKGMTISGLSEATLTTSDNTAMNLLLKELGGPSAVTKFARSIGDSQFRLDRSEPELSSSIPGDKRDTTTPMAMEKSLKNLVLSKTLGTEQRKQLWTWLKNNTTGDARIRAGVPTGWVVGDKTGGSDDYGTTNDIAIIYPPHCKPIVLVVYFTQFKKDATRKDEVVAQVTRTVLDEFAKFDKCIKNDLSIKV